MRNIKLVSIFLSALLLAPTTFAAGVEVFLKDRLDGNLSEYCIDIMGGFANIDPSRGIQAHTCLGYQGQFGTCLLYTSPSPRDLSTSRMPSSA